MFQILFRTEPKKKKKPILAVFHARGELKICQIFSPLNEGANINPWFPPLPLFFSGVAGKRVNNQTWYYDIKS